MFALMCGVAGYPAVCKRFYDEYGTDTPLLDLMLCAAINVTASFNATVKAHKDAGDRGMAFVGFVKRGEQPPTVPPRSLRTASPPSCARRATKQCFTAS